MSNTIEQQGGFFSYLWNNMVASVASRTVGTGMNDGQVTADEVGQNGQWFYRWLYYWL